MTSRERVLKSLNFESSDRIPVDFGGHRSSGIAAIAYARLKEYLGIRTGHIYVYDMIQQLAIVEPEVLDYFGVDTVELGRGFSLDEQDWKEWMLPDGTACLIPKSINVQKQDESWVLMNKQGRALGMQKPGVLYFEQSCFPLMDRGIENDPMLDLEEQMEQCMWTATPSPGSDFELDEAGLEKLSAGAKRLRESTDRAIIGIFGGNLFETPQFLYRSDQYLMAMAMYPEKVLELSEKLTQLYLKRLEGWLKASGPYIDIILFGDDFGSNQAPLISPEMYRTFYKPFHKEMWKRVKEIADVKIQLHSCGAVEPLLDDLIDAGLDMINPVQISACGMSPEELKAKYKGRITFWGGGCDTQHVLPTASPQEIKKHVKQNLRIWGNKGGYVFQQVHNIMANVPPQNICAMFEAVQEFNSGNR